ncbi:MAG: tyrosine-type recombinase/integrase [Bacteroidales bacterium]|nr:tyrosine-type recombinase/integrase [Bacteroidales bacterium]
MALKGQSTKAGYLEWDSMLILLQKLERDRQYKFQLLIAVGCFTGLRASDLLELRWNDLYEKDELRVREGKTNKFRIIRINPQLKEMVTRLHGLMKIADNNELLFLNKNRTKAVNIQYINRRLKEIATIYGLKIPLSDVSSHMFRKSLGRHVWAINNYSEKSLILLSELFNHSSVKVTKIYLGIKQQEIGDVYLNL